MSRRPVELHPAAVREMRAAREWYEERSAAVADQFQQAVDAAIDQIAEHPERWGHYLHGTRVFVLKRFSYLVVYRVVDDAVQVVALAHGKRRPGYWMDRN
jgi:plasmid stabilization system protein ParE